MAKIGNLATIVSAAVLSGALMASPAKATHGECREVATEIIDYIKEMEDQKLVPNDKFFYGAKREVAPDKYTKCVIEGVEKGTDGKYSIKVTIETDTGTTYTIIKKQ